MTKQIPAFNNNRFAKSVNQCFPMFLDLLPLEFVHFENPVYITKDVPIGIMAFMHTLIIV